MRDYITADTISNSIMMMQGQLSGAMILVDREDECRFYEVISHSTAKIIPGLLMAGEVLSCLASRGVGGVVAFVCGAESHDVVAPAFHPSAGDVSFILIDSGAASRVIENIGGRDWVRVVEDCIGPIIPACIRLAKEVCEIYEGSGVVLAHDVVHGFIDWGGLQLDGAALRVECMARKAKATPNDFKTRATVGVLALNFLSCCTKFTVVEGIRSSQVRSFEEIRQMLEVAFHLPDIEKDAIFWKVRGWERCNPKYPIFKKWRELDPLGVVMDQRYWESDVAALVEQEDRVCLVKLDLDNFKNVNDRLGHSMGDAAIILASNVIVDVVGGIGEVYRRGGDEFVIILPGVDELVAEEMSEDLRLQIEKNFIQWSVMANLDLAPTASIGLAISRSRVDVSTLVSLMDNAQKLAKINGKNQVSKSIFSA